MRFLISSLVFGVIAFQANSFPEQSIPPVIDSKLIRPAVFLLEEKGGDAALSAKAIEAAIEAYYDHAISLVELQAKKSEADALLSSLKQDASKKLIPVWVENIIVVCRPFEILVALYPRNAGWTVRSRSQLVQANVLGYNCLVDTKTWHVKTDRAEAVSFRNFYTALSEQGLTSAYSNSSGFEDPLSRNKPKESE